MRRAAWALLILSLAASADILTCQSEKNDPELEAAYQQALKIRSQQQLSNNDKRRVVALLQQAAGVNVTASQRTYRKPVDENEDENGLSLGLVKFSDDLHIEALKLLAELYKQGEGVEVNFGVAHELFSKLAELGDPGAQHEIGFYHAWGITPDLTNKNLQAQFRQPDVRRAILHYYFAASGNHTIAQMALAYRHLHGHGVPQSCQTALLYYMPVAEKVVELAAVAGTLPQLDRVRLTMKLTHGRGLSREHEVLHYQWFADMGYPDAQWKVGHMLTQGADADLGQALQYLRKAHDKGSWDATTFLGHLYANGLGVPQNNDTAREYFKLAADHDHPSGAFGLGYMYLTGHGVNVDYKLALKYLSQASERNMHWPGTSEAWFHLAMMHYHGLGIKKNTVQAVYFLKLASQAKHMLAMYTLAMIQLTDKNHKSGCKTAVELLKGVAERGPWAAAVQDAYDDFMQGEYENAFWKYLRGAEMGIELAQINAAWMLNNGYGYEGDAAASVAVVLHRYAAEQGCVESLLALGDSYYYGQGLDQDWHKAVDMYRGASEHRHPQALYNLGFMHQYGAGMAQDFHLAKRYYDKALEVEPKAAVAIQLALWNLNFHSWWTQNSNRLPKWSDHILSHIFTLSDNQPAHVQESAPASGNIFRGLGSLLDGGFDFVDELLGRLSAMSEQAETFLLLLLCVLLYGVLRRRQVLRRGGGGGGGPLTTQQQQQAQQVPFDVPSVAHTNVAAVQPGAAASAVPQASGVPHSSSPPDAVAPSPPHNPTPTPSTQHTEITSDQVTSEDSSTTAAS